MVISTPQLSTWTVFAAPVPNRSLLVDEDAVGDLPEVFSSEPSPERESTDTAPAPGQSICFFSWLPHFEIGEFRFVERRVSTISSQIRRRADAVGRTLSGMRRRYALLFGGNFQPRGSKPSFSLSFWNQDSANSLQCTTKPHAGFFRA